jgi:hypothetical protein
MFGLVKEVAPSIILFVEANDFDAKTYPELNKQSRKILKKTGKKGEQSVQLVDLTPEADAKLVASLLHSTSSCPYVECLEKARGMKTDDRREFVKHTFKHMEFYDSVLREFEFVSLTYNLIVSASCFAQLKRHRIATITTQSYDPDLGVTVPPAVREVGGEEDFLDMIKETERVYGLLKADVGQAADYILTNAHRRRVLLKLNARELYHVSRLREDATAQWEIRDITSQMTEQASSEMPITCLLIGGKDAYPRLYRALFGKKSRFHPPVQ